VIEDDSKQTSTPLDQTMGTTAHVPQGGVIRVFAVRS
jgi:hypothetical protein